MKKAVVLGASGGMGYAIMSEWLARGMHAVAFARNKGRLHHLYGQQEQAIICPGDALQINDLHQACEGAEIVFHAINLPYKDWGKQNPIIMHNIIEVIRETGAKLVYVDNIYAFGRFDGEKMCEDHPKQPHTRKGKVRLELENMLWEAVQKQGIQALQAYFPDFYGPHAPSTLLHYTFQSMAAGKRAMFVGDLTNEREYILTTDGAKALIALALSEGAYGQSWNIAGGIIDGRRIVEIAAAQLGYNKKVGKVGTGMMMFAGLFNSQIRESIEMDYLRKEPIFLDSRKYEALLGPLPKTPFEEGIRLALKHMEASHE